MSYFIKNIIRFLATGVLTLCMSVAAADEVRGVYLPTFTFSNANQTTVQNKINEVISKMQTYKFNTLYIEVRIRGDAYYIPNRNSSLYPNPEPRTQAYSFPSGFDGLQYAIDRGHAAGIKVVAWLVTYASWSSATLPSATHVTRAHADWITTDWDGNPATYIDGQSTSLDPGIVAVQDYLTNIYLDVVRNYDVDGIHFDYFRLPENGRVAGEWSKFGYNSLGLAQFTADTGLTYATPSTDPNGVREVYQQWMREQVDNLAKRVWIGTKKEKPWVEVSSFIVNFDNSPVTLAQSYNMWTTRGHFDYIVGGSYADGSYVDSYWNRMVSNIQVPGGTALSRPVVFAAGSDDAAFGNTATTIKDTVNNVRSKSPAGSGFAHFAYAGLSANTDTLFHALSDAGNPFATPAAYPSPSVMNAVTADSVAPNAAASPTFNVVAGRPTITFNRPATAADGDYPVEYRIYRDDATPPVEDYANLKMVFWDSPSARTSFSWTDANPISGTSYYSVVAYDDWHNRAAATVGSYTAGLAEMIIETVAPGQNSTLYADLNMQGPTTTKSTASGLNSGVTQSRYSSNTALTASGTYSPGLTGNYDIYVTISNGSNNQAENTKWEVKDGTTVKGSGNVALVFNDATVANNWKKFASNVALTPTTQVVFSEQTPQTNRFVMDAIRLVPVLPTGTYAAWENKPSLGPIAQKPPINSLYVLDNDTRLLNFAPGSGWSTSTFGTVYGTNKHYASSAIKARKCVWSFDLPCDGQYDLKAWVNNGAYSTTAKYQFRAYSSSSLTTQQTYTITASQANKGNGFVIDADGAASDTSSPWFKAGKVYVSVWDDSGSAEQVLADAIQFKLVAYTGAGIDGWDLY